MSRYKIPISSLVVIYTKQLDILLLSRADKSNFWQSVTGSLEADESPLETAKREVLEETGIVCENYLLQDWNLSHEYKIFSHWQYRYAPGVIYNTEHIFGLELPEKLPVTLSPNEHIDFKWVTLEEAKKKVFSWTNVKALEKLYDIKLLAS
jgi:dATP pyrophosphohydrolase